MSEQIFGRLHEVFEFRKTLTAESDRGCALMAAAFLDAELDALLRCAVVDNPRVAEEMFGQARPISSFSSRIDMVYLLGLIGQDARRDLHLIRRIRNEFGHVHTPITFDTPAIAARCAELRLAAYDPGGTNRGRFVTVALGVIGLLHGAAVEHVRPKERAAVELDRVREWHAEVMTSIISSLSSERPTTSEGSD